MTMFDHRQLLVNIKNYKLFQYLTLEIIASAIILILISAAVITVINNPPGTRISKSSNTKITTEPISSSSNTAKSSANPSQTSTPSSQQNNQTNSSQSPADTTSTVQSPPPVNQTSINSITCTNEGGSWYNSLVSEDASNSSELTKYDIQISNAYYAGQFNGEVGGPLANALSLINSNINSVNSNYVTDFNDYMVPMNQYGCTPKATSALQALQCSDITQCVSEVPSR